MLTLDDDNDFDHQKRVRQTVQHAEYDGPDEEDFAMIQKENELDAGDSESQPELRVHWREEDEQSPEALDEKLEGIDFNDMKLLNANLSSFTFDKAKGEWCKLEFVVYPLLIGLTVVPLENGQDFDGEHCRKGLSRMCGT
jgi:hypothetical protein